MRTVVFIKVFTKTIKNTDLEFTLGQMGKPLKVIGLVENKKAMVNIQTPKEYLKKDSGKTV